jgi:uncharacterized ferredoxin-like protein
VQAIPLSVKGKNIFFDKNRPTMQPENRIP